MSPSVRPARRPSEDIRVLKQPATASSFNTKQLQRDKLEQERDLEMPGTPPIVGQSRRMWGEATPKQTEARRLAEQEKLQPADQHAARHAAALIMQRLVRCFLARTKLFMRRSAVGRPVELQITGVQRLELLFDYRTILSVYCNVRVLKKPFGPFMFHFSTNKCTKVTLPTWEDKFYIPMLSSKCDIVTTLIGVTNTGGLRFLGQAIIPMEPGWENKTKICAPLAKWKFPVDECVVGLHRFSKGTMELEIKPISSRMPCKSGQFFMAPPVITPARQPFSFWTRKVSSNASLTSPAPVTPRKTPSSDSSLRKTLVTRWGVLTDTSFLLFDNTTAELLVSLDLAKLQIVKSSTQPKNDPSRPFPLKMYAKGSMYVLYVSSYAQQQLWEYKINLRRRASLIP
ncbi:hypothetical protein KXD40_004344 [Peronospora effusa]|uniref:Uncharacterized protein n=1 Tax=Peronospora effusa TaxID=542832 RepID=A0A3M6VIM3_9STRA|nr:hypothetical protein DD238_003892 [Peronospora effusa]UIZ27959.1 hypothetical protein KXD40_004344 [Peronospora effusa]CAI5722976.1 unnamed protein product [Peronospora effusa]